MHPPLKCTRVLRAYLIFFERIRNPNSNPKNLSSSIPTLVLVHTFVHTFVHAFPVFYRITSEKEQGPVSDSDDAPPPL